MIPPMIDARAVPRFSIRMRSAARSAKARTLYLTADKAKARQFGNDLIAEWRERGHRVKRVIRGLWSVSNGRIVAWLEFASIRS